MDDEETPDHDGVSTDEDAPDDGQGRDRDRDRYAAAVVDAIRDGAYVLDADRVRVFANDRLREVTGFDDDLLLAKHPERLVEAGYWPEEEGDRYREAAERVLSGDAEEERIQLTTTLDDGSSVTTETRLTPLTAAELGRIGNGADGGDDPLAGSRIVGVVGVIRDVTARVERERELERLNERLERLSGFLSHDLRNPLSVARGYVDLTRETGDLDRLDPAEEALDRIGALIDDALVLAREPAAIAVEETAVDLGELARDCWESGDFGDPSAGATLVVEDGGPVLADPSLLRRALGNLLSNAFEHAGEAPTVRVGVDDRGVYVADDGPGLPEEEREAVTEFGVSKDGGTGIGLAIVERVAAAHGWTLEVGESRAGGFEARLVGAEPTA
ncbi:PAS domain-containing sensor histidine kinase [Halorubrum halodurans]|uniref:histidine kinase n=1 Tax=Halorubrum halodurans TaxID=1383851 RepID=A0A256IIX8_9EURY|nr:PAS domain-containing sensor histidine kinase [Halorubrum halodurans]OYR56511.1 PAS domain-containing sensor histidine kinase [Halorubrum halodurans]